MAIIPTGSQLAVYPVAPNIGNPANYALNIPQALQVASAGVLYGQQLANLQNDQASRELEASRIKAAKAQNDYALAVNQDAQQRLPQVFQHLTALQQAQALNDQNSLGQAQASLGSGAATGAAQLTQAQTAQTQALADQTAFGNMNSAQRAAVGANAPAIGNALGSIGVPMFGATPAPAAAAPAVQAAAPASPSVSPAFGDITTALPGAPLAAAAVSPAVAPLANATATPAAPVPAIDGGAPAAAAADAAAPSPNAPPGSPAAVKYTAVTGLPVAGSSGNVILDSIVARAKLPITLEQNAKMQDDSRALLKQFNVPQDVRDKLMTAPGSNVYNVDNVQRYVDSIKDQQPKVTYGAIPGFNDAYDKASDIKQTQSFVNNTLPALLTQLGDPSAFSKTVEQMRDTDPNKGFFMKTLANYAAAGTPPNVAARSAVIDYLDNRYQTVFNNTDVGRRLKNSLAVSDKDSNATILQVTQALDPLLDKQYAKEKNGYPADAFKTLDDGSALNPQTPGAIAGQRQAAASNIAGSVEAAFAPPPSSASPVTSQPVTPGTIKYGANGQKYIFTTQNGVAGWLPQ